MKFTYIAVAVIVTLVLSPVCAQDIEPVIPPIPGEKSIPAPPAVAQPAEPIPVPVVSPDPAIFKRTPVIDGRIEQGEWDQHFRFDYGDLHAWTYLNWDDDNFYVASKSSAPTDLLVILDANADGWFHGADNYEFTVRRGQGGGNPVLSVSRYDSHASSEGGGVPVAAKSSAFTVKAGSATGSYVYELVIPKASVTGLNPKPESKIGLKVAVGAGDRDVQWIPNAPLGDVQTAQLVGVKNVATDSLKVDVRLSDNRLAPGEELVAKITVKNAGEQASAADTIVVGGEGKTAKLLGSQLVRLEGIRPKGSTTTTFKTPIPSSAQAGSGALGVEVRAGDKRAAACLVSFDIVPAYELSLDTGSQPLEPGRYHRLTVTVKNNTQRSAFGRVKLSLPKGWQFRRSDSDKEFYIRDHDGQETVAFRVKVPQGAKGKIPVLAEAWVGRQNVSVSGVLEVK